MATHIETLFRYFHPRLQTQANRDISGFRMDPSLGTSLLCLLCLDWFDPSETFMPSWSLNNHILPAANGQVWRTTYTNSVLKVLNSLKACKWKGYSLKGRQKISRQLLGFYSCKWIKIFTSLIIRLHFNYFGNIILMKISGPESG